MKKYFTFLITFYLVSWSLAQNITSFNGNFEQWTNEAHATYWQSDMDTSLSLTMDNTPITATIDYHALHQTTDAHSGDFAGQLSTQNVSTVIYGIMPGPSVKLPGICQLGQFDLSNLINDIISEGVLSVDYNYISKYLIGGIACNELPVKVKAWLKYSTPESDTLSCVLIATRWNNGTREIVGQGTYTASGSINDYTQIVIPVTREIEEIQPDTLNIIFSNGTNTSIDAATTLYIDDVEIIMDDTKIFNLNRGALFSIYPNPTSDYLSINAINNNPYQIHIFDTNGKLILEKVDLHQNTRIDIHNFPSGIYFIQIQQEGNTYTEKIIIQ